GLRVLVVDDDPDALDLIATILRRAEAETRLCSSPPEALAMLRSWKPHVLVSDIEMPGEDGYSLIRKVRELGGSDGGQIPAVALAAQADRAGLGGIVLFTRNCPTLETVLALTAEARSLDPDLLVLVDHEGGRVHRLPSPFTRFPTAATIGRTGEPRLAAAVAS